MSDIAIKIESLSKSYLVGHNTAKVERYTALRDVIARNARNLARKTRDLIAGRPSIQGDEIEEFWALKDISFEIKRGETIGIIGRNGAGKSTLLKILSRITEPTTGQITIDGRVASLLEVGTGFHPELTGRENIYLNGAILGMARAEIRRKFDEIVAFAEVEKFLDTPVKRYSSGMYVRLAFSVAAHLEPEILIVDEVLAVGDAAFQKKCLGKMGDVARAGRTVLFVSHQMAAVQSLCGSCILLGQGGLKYYGGTRDTIERYLAELEREVSEQTISNLTRSGDGSVILTSFSVENEAGEVVSSVCSGDSVTLSFGYRSQDPLRLNNLSFGFSLHNNVGDRLMVFYSHYAGQLFNLNKASGKIRCQIKDFPFSTGIYYIGARIKRNETETDWPKGFVGHIKVENGDFYNNGHFGADGIGPFLINGEWSAT